MRLVEEEAQLRLGQVPYLGQRLVQPGEHPEHERREEPGLIHDVRQLEDADDPLALGRRSEQVGDVELGLAEEDVGAGLLEHDDRAKEDADRGARHPAVVGEDRLAVVRGEVLERRGEVLEVEQRQVVVVAVLEDEREDRGLRVVEVEDLAEEQRAERVGGGPDLGAELARQRQVLDRVTGRLVRPPERGHPLDDLRVRRVARRRHPRQVALDIGHEDRHARLGQLSGEQLEGLRLAGARGPGDESVAVHHAQRHLDARIVVELARKHRAADHEAGLRKRVTGRHLVVERLVHRSSGGCRRVFSGGGQAYHRGLPARASMDEEATPHEDRRSPRPSRRALRAGR